jgi:hypothetical protein
MPRKKISEQLFSDPVGTLMKPWEDPRLTKMHGLSKQIHGVTGRLGRTGMLRSGHYKDRVDQVGLDQMNQTYYTQTTPRPSLEFAYTPPDFTET